MTLNIVFSGFKKAFFPGQEIKGVVLVNLPTEEKISSVLICFDGYGHLHAKGKDGNIKTESETYLNEVIILFDAAHGENINKYFQRGVYEYPFTYVLPKRVPVSFETPQGHVTYSATAHLLKGKHESIESRTYFTVNAIVDLNYLPKCQLPAAAYFEEDMFCTFCLGHGMLSAVLNISRTGYVPGEYIMLNAEINNACNNPISYVKVSLVQVIKYKYKGGSKKIKRTVAEAVRGALMSRESQIWRDVKLEIPPVVPSYHIYCNLLRIRYNLYLHIGAPVNSSTKKAQLLKVPITIGTVPLLCYKHLYIIGTEDLPIHCADIPKPNFKPCSFGPYYIKDICTSNSTNITQFSPLYVTYSMAGYTEENEEIHP